MECGGGGGRLLFGSGGLRLRFPFCWIGLAGKESGTSDLSDAKTTDH